MEYLLGIDVGTTSTRTIIINEDGRLISSSTKEYKMYTPKPGWAEQDPDDWWNAVVYTIKDAVEKSNISPGKISCMGLTGQMHGSVFVDNNGKVIRPAILWCDQRTQKQCDEIYDIFGYKNFIKLSYNKALTGFTAPKILWLKEVEPENYKKVAKILLPKDYIRYKLSGIYATEVSDASGTILMNIATRNWSDEILDGLNIDKGLLPSIHESTHISSKISELASKFTGLTKGLPIAGGGGDQAVGAVGSGIVKEGLISDYIGTSGVVFAHSDKPVFDSLGRLHSFCHAVPGKWHLMGVTLSAAGSLKWYNDNFGPSGKISKTYPDKEEYELLNKQAENIPAGSNGLLFLPYLSGERTPYADPYARGVFFGISYLHGQDHFVRSIMEGVAFSQFDCLSLMKEIGIISSKIVLYGGGAKSKIWRQIISDIFSTKIVTLNIEEGPAYGAALIAGAGCGIYKSVEEACDRVIKEVNKNNPIEENVLKYNELYKIYNSLYKNLKDDFKKIDSIS